MYNLKNLFLVDVVIVLYTCIQNVVIFVQLDELDELDRITHAECIFVSKLYFFLQFV